MAQLEIYMEIWKVIDNAWKRLAVIMPPLNGNGLLSKRPGLEIQLLVIFAI